MTAKMSGNPATRSTLEAVRRFNEAFDRHDVDGVMAAMTDDCVFENTCPTPDGERYAGARRGAGVLASLFLLFPRLPLHDRGDLRFGRPLCRPLAV